MQKHLTIITLFLLSFSAMAQKSAVAVEGRVVDDKETALMGATVVLLQQADSVIAKFNITDEAGHFSLSRITPGDYILQISYIGYSPYSQPIALSAEKSNYQLGNISIATASTNLDEVLISAEHVPMVMNGDTLEYNSAAFKVAPNAAVEELLKKLPGIEVARDGSIKAQGKNVTKVMVDGKEFFGNDPTIATKNLPADAIEKVQVFDKKSDMAEFSGIDDGMEQKTINLKLKDDKKQGYFGNASGGYGTDDRYDGKFNLNRFGKKTQASAIGMVNNINKQGFSFNDYINFMGGMGNFMSGGGGRMTIEMDGDGGGLPLDFNGQDGLTNIGAGGINLNSDLTKKTALNTSYFYNHSKNILDRSVTRQSLLGETRFTSLDEDFQTTSKTNHRLSLTLKHEIDSFQNLTLRANGSFNSNLRNNTGNTKTFAEVLENESIQDYFSEQNGLRANGNFIYQRRFNKKGRFFTSDLSYQLQSGNQNGKLFSVNNLYANNLSDTTNQRQLYDTKKEGFGLKFSYTEPMGKYKYLELNLSRQQYKSTLEKQFYDVLFNTEVLNSELGNAYTLDYAYNQVGLNFRYNKKKLNFTTGLSLQQTLLEGNSVSAPSIAPKEFLYFLPSMRLQYDFKTTKNLSLSYQTSVREPSVRQLQPVVDNSNPLSIYTGNPNLKPEYSHRMNAFFMIYDQFNFTSFHANMSSIYTRDKITTKQSIDDFFVQNRQPVNVEDDFMFQGSLSFSTPLRPIKSRINLRADLTYNRGILFVNDIKDKSNIRQAGFDISLDNRKKKVLDIMLGANFKFNQTGYLESPQFNQQFSKQTYYTDLAVNIGDKWKLNSSFDYQVYSRESFGLKKGIPLWQASLSLYVMKKKGELKFSAFDLLNKNVGINRVSELNFTQEEQIKSLGRYFMLGFAYSISGFGNRTGISVETSRQR